MDNHLEITEKNNLHIHNDCKLSIKYIHKKDRCRSSFRRVFPEQSGKNQCQLTMPVADFELRILYRRVMETGPKKDDEGEGKVYLRRRDQKILAYFIEQNDSSAGP